jgi:outer membrane protein assembly factor BamB
MQKIFIGIGIILSVLIACKTDIPVNESAEPDYTAKIIWKSNTNITSARGTIIDGDFIFAYDRYKDETSDKKLVKISAQTGEIQWRSAISEPVESSLIIIGDYIYVFLMEPGSILCFNKQTGTLAAKVRVDINNQSLEIVWNIIGYGNYLYFGIGNGSINSYFVRLNADVINKDGNVTKQVIEPEILWRPKYDWPVYSTPAINNNIIYVHTLVGITSDLDPIELVGINIDTKEVVFNMQFGFNDNDNEYYDLGRTRNALFAYQDVLYYIGGSIAAWDLKTWKQKYLKTFTPDMPPKQNYAAGSHIEITYWNEKIYYTNLISNIIEHDDYKNIYCIDTRTGNLVWSDIPPYSESLKTNPIITHNRMYVPHGYGLRVYNPETGKLIGVDKNFRGNAIGRNVLYGDYLITTRFANRNTDENSMVAIYVGE